MLRIRLVFAQKGDLLPLGARSLLEEGLQIVEERSCLEHEAGSRELRHQPEFAIELDPVVTPAIALRRQADPVVARPAEAPPRVPVRRGEHARAALDEDAAAQTPESRMLAMASRSTRISMKARSNLWRQPSEAWASFPVGTEMILASAMTLTSAPRTCAVFCR